MKEGRKEGSIGGKYRREGGTYRREGREEPKEV